MIPKPLLVPFITLYPELQRLMLPMIDRASEIAKMISHAFVDSHHCFLALLTLHSDDRSVRLILKDRTIEDMVAWVKSLIRDDAPCGSFRDSSPLFSPLMPRFIGAVAIDVSHLASLLSVAHIFAYFLSRPRNVVYSLYKEHLHHEPRQLLEELFDATSSANSQRMVHYYTRLHDLYLETMVLHL